MEILIVGSGAIGGFYGGMLSLLPEVNIHFLCRSDYDVVAKEGIEIASPWKNFHFYPTGVLKQGMRSPVVFDYVVVTLKVLPNIFLAKVIGDYVNKKTSILLLQNGVGIEQGVVQAFPENEILSGLAFTCIHRTAPGKIKHLDYGHLSIGSFSKEQSKTASQLSELFNKAGVKCEVAKDIVSARGGKKLVWNAPFNPISVLSGGRDTTAILQNKKTLQLVQNVMQEVCHLAELDGHRLADDVASKMIEMTLSMEPYKTSMLLDYESHREMEVEAILGNPLKIAKQHNAKLPYMETLYALLSIMNHES